MISYSFQQEKFNDALRRYLARLKNDKLPKAINKKGFFIALRAYGETPKKEPFAIAKELSRQIEVTNKQCQTRWVPLLFVLAAKRVGYKWPEQRMTANEGRKRAQSLVGIYRKALAKKAASILSGRKRAAGFLRVGWLSAMRRLSVVAGTQRPPSGDAKLRGAMKGDATAARPSLLRVTVTNTAQATSDRRSGLIRFGAPALNRAFAKETADIVAYLERETKAETEQANRELK